LVSSPRLVRAAFQLNVAERAAFCELDTTNTEGHFDHHRLFARVNGSSSRSCARFCTLSVALAASRSCSSAI